MICRRCGSEMPDDSMRCLNCGESVSAVDTQQTYNTYYENYGAGMQTKGAVAGTQKTSQGALKWLVVLALLAVIGAVAWFSGVFESKNGVYSSDLMQSMIDMAASMGLDTTGFEGEMTLTVNGKNCVMRVAISYDGQEYSETETGTINFSGNKVYISFDDEEEISMGTYDKKKKSITFSAAEGEEMGAEELEEMLGFSEIVFVKE